MALGFTWHPKKAANNRRKHGVDFVDAMTAFDDPFSITTPDTAHADDEERYHLMGLTKRGQLVVIAHADEGHQIRLINARAATRRERQSYEEDQ
jgi:hypothetical protein